MQLKVKTDDVKRAVHLYRATVVAGSTTASVGTMAKAGRLDVGVLAEGGDGVGLWDADVRGFEANAALCHGTWSSWGSMWRARSSWDCLCLREVGGSGISLSPHRETSSTYSLIVAGPGLATMGENDQ